MTPNRADEAVAAFRRGLSCSQAILSVYGKDLGIDAGTAEKIAWEQESPRLNASAASSARFVVMDHSFPV